MRSNSKLIVLLFLTFILTSSSLISQTVIRVNCGGSTYRDRFGNTWSTDQAYKPGSWGHVMGGYALNIPLSIAGTVDDPLYQAERNALDFYRFTVPNGEYVVTLKFAELFYKKEGQRIYHVDIEGNRVMENFDMIATAGFARAIDRTFQVNVNDGRLDIHFVTIYTAPGISIAHSNVKAIGVEEQGSQEPKLWIEKTELKLGKKTFNRTFEIKNGGAKPLIWNVFENPDETWIKSVLPAGGTLLQNQPQQIEVKVSRSGLDEGDYKGKISVQSNGGNKDVNITMRVENDFPIPEIEPAELAFGSLLVKRSFLIKNLGTATLDWDVENANSVPWITAVVPLSGRVPVDGSQIVDVLIDRGATAEAVGEHLLRIASNGDDETLNVTFDNGNEPLRVNCGGPHYVDTAENNWIADIAFSDGYSVSNHLEFLNTFDDELYQEVCSGMTAYQFAVQENGFYNVSMHFAESELGGVGERIFDVFVEDSLMLDDFDVNASAGPQNVIVESCNTNTNDGLLDIAFVPVVGEVQMSAVEIFKIPAEPFLSVQPEIIHFSEENTEAFLILKNLGAQPLQWKIQDSETAWLSAVTPDSGELAYNEIDSVKVTVLGVDLLDGIYETALWVTSNGGSVEVPVSYQVGMVTNYSMRVNCGGEVYIDSESRTWAADQPYSPDSWGYIGGEIYSTRRPIIDTQDDPLYRTERWGLESYVFDLPNGHYEVILHFAEIYVRDVGRRIFSVDIEDEAVIRNLDIFAEVGIKTAMSISAQISVIDKQLNIDFIRDTEDPKISAIEVLGDNGLVALENESSTFDASASGLIPDRIHLNQNYPNPFNMDTNISFGLPVESDVMLEVYNLMGQRQAILFDGSRNAGYHSLTWNGLDMYNVPVASGFYVYRIRVYPNNNDYSPYHSSRKMLLLK